LVSPLIGPPKRERKREEKKSKKKDREASASDEESKRKRGEKRGNRVGGGRIAVRETQRREKKKKKLRLSLGTDEQERKRKGADQKKTYSSSLLLFPLTPSIISTRTSQVRCSEKRGGKKGKEKRKKGRERGSIPCYSDPTKRQKSEGSTTQSLFYFQPSAAGGRASCHRKEGE